MTSQLNGKFNGLYLPNGTRYTFRGKFVKTTGGLLHRFKMSWTLVYKRLEIGSEFLPTLRKFCILVFAHEGSANGTQLNFAKLQKVDLNLANNLPQISWGRSSRKKLGAKKTLHIFVFFDDFWFFWTEHGTDSQARASMRYYTGSPISSPTFIGLQTA